MKHELRRENKANNDKLFKNQITKIYAYIDK